MLLNVSNESPISDPSGLLSGSLRTHWLTCTHNTHVCICITSHMEATDIPVSATKRVHLVCCVYSVYSPQNQAYTVYVNEGWWLTQQGSCSVDNKGSVFTV